MKYYKYHSISVYLLRIIGSIFLLFGLVLSPLVPIGLYRIVINYPKIIPTESLIMLGLIIFFLFLGIILTNLFPNLAVDSEGLYVRFYFRWLFVPWENVVSFRESFISALVPSSRKLYFILVKKKLTTIHWLIGLNQLGGWGPGFLVSQSISDYKDFAHSIKEHLVS